jgi:hypothetical protein
VAPGSAWGADFVHEGTPDGGQGPDLGEQLLLCDLGVRGDRQVGDPLHELGVGAVDQVARPQDANLLAVYAAERGHLAKLAGQMVAGKLDEQRSLISEKTVEQLELALTGILRDLGHDPATEYVRQICGSTPRCSSTGR